MATNTLIILDGNGNPSGLSTFSGSKGLIPEHVISGAVNVTSSLAAPLYISSSAGSPVLVTGTVNVNNYPAITTVTASSTNPVYVTGTVTVSQPVNVDLVVGDTITASIANTGFAQAIEAITQSYNSGGGYGKINVQLTGSSVLPQGAYNSLLVTTTASTITVDNTGFSGMIQAITESYDSGGGSGKLKVKVQQDSVITASISNTPTVTVGNSFFNDAIVALSHSYYTANGGASNALAIKLRDKNAYAFDESHEALLVRTSGSSVTVDNIGFTQLIGGITASLDSSNNEFKLKVKITGSTEDSPIFVTGNLNTQLFGINKYSLPDGSALVVKVTGSSQSDPVTVSGTVNIPVGKYGYSEGQALVVKITGSSQNDPVTVSGAVDIGISKYGYSGGQALVVKVTASTESPYSVTLDGISSYVYSGGAAIVTKITGNTENQPIWVTGTVSQVFATSSIKKRVFLYEISPIDERNQFFNWSSIHSGTVLVASSSLSRKGLSIFNPTSTNIYISVGDDTNYNDPYTFGFDIYNTSSAPNFYSFILYPSGTYISEPANARLLHGIYAISGNYSQNPILITETY